MMPTCGAVGAPPPIALDLTCQDQHCRTDERRTVATIQHIGVLAHPLRPQTHPVAERIRADVQASGIQTTLFTRWEADDVRDVIATCQLVIAIGGDGAMLRAARACAPYAVPVLGVNMGHLGFLTEINTLDDLPAALARVLGGDYWVENRMMIRAELVRQGAVVASADALNDVVISGSVIGKMVLLSAYIDGDWTTTYYADALVIATATGSTAYALATGGPILPPELKNILIVPAAPHLSMDRPIVLSEGAQVEIVPEPNTPNDVIITADGVSVAAVQLGDRIQLCASDYITRFIRLRGRNYFYRSLLDRLEPRVRRSGLERHESS